MRYELKAVIVWSMHLLTWPMALLALVDRKLLRAERMFDFFSKALSLVPGMPGQYLRTSFYMQTLSRCHYDVCVGFGSFFSHMTAEVGRGVKIGSFSIIGTAVLEDNVVVSSRVSILSGKYHHGGGYRGRDIKNNQVCYEKVSVGEGSWLGEGSIVMCDIGRHCIVSAGSVVTRPIADDSTAIGNPARCLRYWDPRVTRVRSRSRYSALGLLAFLLGAVVVPPDASADASRHIVLIGASIGRAWDVEALPRRLAMSGVRFEYVGVPDTFDKSAAVAALVRRPSPPDAVILKECAVFFPGPLSRYRALMSGWIERLRAAGITPIPATVAPVAPGGPWSAAKDWIKVRLLSRPSRMQQLTAYNDWLRALAGRERLPLLDLERALRRSEDDRRLRAELAADDGIHLRRSAYALLDAQIPRLLTQVDAMATR